MLKCLSSKDCRGIAISEGQRVQSADAAGQQFMFQAGEESRAEYGS